MIVPHRSRFNPRRLLRRLLWSLHRLYRRRAQAATGAPVASSPALRTLDQRAFEQLMAESAKAYRVTDDPTQRSAHRLQRDMRLSSLLMEGRWTFRSWRGTLAAKTVDAEGKISLLVKLAGMTLKTFSGKPGFEMLDTRISPGSEVHSMLNQLQPGDAVEVSGTFFPKETSLTE